MARTGIDDRLLMVVLTRYTDCYRQVFHTKSTITTTMPSKVSRSIRKS
jgi:hypothetical protein